MTPLDFTASISIEIVKRLAVAARKSDERWGAQGLLGGVRFILMLIFMAMPSWIWLPVVFDFLHKFLIVH